jgi:nucleotide-binding universal stress UspA family protein
VQIEPLNGVRGMSPKKGAWLVEVRPDEELPEDFCVSLHRILVPTALDEDSAVALDYALALARRFGSELSLLYSLEDSDYARSSRVEAELRTCFSALLIRHLQARFFLRPGPTGEQVKNVANALGADLIVTSSGYHRRFLSCLTHEENGLLRVQGVSCPVVLVSAYGKALGRTFDSSLQRGRGG